MRVATDVQASFGSCCSCAAVETAVDASAEAMAAVTDATVSGSSYSFCAAAETTTASDASDRLIGLPNTKRQELLPFLCLLSSSLQAGLPLTLCLCLSVGILDLSRSLFCLRTRLVQFVCAVPIYDQSSHGLTPQ